LREEPVALVWHARAHAIDEMIRKDGGLDMSFEVRFAIDADGAWRLESL
jgi:hypothetical protein